MFIDEPNEISTRKFCIKHQKVSPVNRQWSTLMSQPDFLGMFLGLCGSCSEYLIASRSRNRHPQVQYKIDTHASTETCKEHVFLFKGKAFSWHRTICQLFHIYIRASANKNVSDKMLPAIEWWKKYSDLCKSNSATIQRYYITSNVFHSKNISTFIGEFYIIRLLI